MTVGQPSFSTGTRRPLVLPLVLVPASAQHPVRPSALAAFRTQSDRGIALADADDGSLWLFKTALASRSMTQPKPASSPVASPGSASSSLPPLVVAQHAVPLAPPSSRPPPTKARTGRLSTDATYLDTRRASSPSSRHRAVSSASASSSRTTPAQPPSLPGTYRSSRIASISGISAVQAATPVLSGVEESVAERKEDLRELLAGKDRDNDEGDPFSSSRRPSRAASIASTSRRPTSPPPLSTPQSPSSLPFVQLPHSPLSAETRKSFSLSQTNLLSLGSRAHSMDGPLPEEVLLGGGEEDWVVDVRRTVRIFPARASRRNHVTSLGTVGDQGSILALSAQGTLSSFSSKDGTCSSSTHLPTLDPSLRNLHWSSLLVLPSDSIQQRALLVGQPPERTSDGDDHRVATSRVVLIDLHTLKLVGAGTEVVGRVDGLELTWDQASSNGGNTVELLASSSHPSTFTYLTLSTSPPAVLPSPLLVAPPLSRAGSTEGSSRPVDAIRDFFQRNNAKKDLRLEELQLLPEISTEWKGSSVEVDEFGVDLGEEGGRGMVLLEKKRGQVRVVVWGDAGFNIYSLDDHKAALLTSLTADLVGLTRAADNRLHLSMTSGRASWSLNKTDVNGDAASGRGKKVYSGTLGSFSGPPVWSALSTSASPTDLIEVITTASHFNIALSPTGSPLKDLLTLSIDEEAEYASVLASAGDQALGEVFVGDSRGRVTRQTLSIVGQVDPAAEDRSPSLDGKVTCVQHVSDPSTGKQHLVAGSEEGGFAILDPSTLDTIFCQTLFTAPVRQLLILDTLASRRHACVAVVSEQSDLAIVDLNSATLAFLVPAARSPLAHLFLGDEQVTLVYENDSARQWDLNTGEMLRSLDRETALTSAREDGWDELPLSGSTRLLGATPKSLLKSTGLRSDDQANSLRLDAADLLASLPTTRSVGETLVHAKSHASEQGLGGIVSLLLSWGLDAEMDARIEEGLQLQRPAVEPEMTPGLMSLGGFISAPAAFDPTTSWKVSSQMTGSRLLGLISILQLYLTFESMESAASEIISFYTTRLPEVVGDDYIAASLDFYADFWLHPTPEIQQASRVLFGATMARSSDKELVEIVESLQSRLPACQPKGQGNSDEAARALILVGQIVVENYSLFSASLLKDVAQSVTLYLNDSTSPYRALGIDLCSAGFQIWQHYVDAMEVLRALFHLATNKSTGGITLQARNASFHVASTNTPLFMTTLSYDIINATSPEQRNSTMKLVALLAKRKPLILYSSLPRILEAVVKSLDPNLSGLRDTVHSTATVILESLVNSFPSVAFHGKSQKLGVGTLEGAVIMYDLKTATRLYVLDGHKHKVTACSFSPDGRRLVTVSLEESKVVIWKTGMSFGSLFNVGVPPRQGGPAAGDPYKTYDFNIGSEGNMTTLASLEWVRFEWPGERSARLRVRETALTFAT